MNVQQNAIDWLLDSDPAIRWQVLKDLQHEPPEAHQAEKARLTETGWCADLLGRQDGDGQWNRSLYNGKWLSTTYSLYLLKLLGLPERHPQAWRGCEKLIRGGLYKEQEIRFSRNQAIPDLGVTAIVLSLCCYFNYRMEALPKVVRFLIDQQHDDGCWRPNDSTGSVHYTFETTLLVLEALLQYERRVGTEGTSLPTATRKGQEFLLRSNLGLVDGKPLKAEWAIFSYPPYWFYDFLTALGYFREFRANRDGRLGPAIDLLRKRQTPEDKWSLGRQHPGKTYFEMEKAGQPSRWNTLRALRVLEWWDNG